MRAFVAGATGYTGRHLVPALRKRGVEVWAHVRPDSPADERIAAFEATGAHVDRTPWDADGLRARIQELRPDLVYALLGTTAAKARALARQGIDASYERVDYGYTAMLITACEGLDTRFVYLSAAGAAGQKSGYMGARARAEALLRASGLPHTIARPAFITGPDRGESRPLERVGAALGDALVAGVGLVAPAARKWRSLSGDALAEALARHTVDAPRDGVLEVGDLHG